MEHKQILVDIETMIREEQPRIGAYLEQKMKLIPESGLSREMFREVAQELSELMFAVGIGRTMGRLKGNIPAVQIDGPRGEVVMS